MFVNVWRTTGNPRAIKDAWGDMFPGSEFMPAAFRRLPPRPLKGRWSAVIDLERWIIASGDFVELPRVLARAALKGGHSNTAETKPNL